MSRLVVDIITLLIVAVLTEAEYQLEIQLVRYSNPTHEAGQFRVSQQIRDYCDALGNPCENRFIFCLREKGAPVTGRLLEEQFCPLGRYSTGVVIPEGDDDSKLFTFGEDLEEGVPNPLVFTLERWPEAQESVELAIQVYDVDDAESGVQVNAEDQVDVFFINIDNFLPQPPQPADDYFYDHEPVLGEYEFATIHLRSRLSSRDLENNGSDYMALCEERDDEYGHYVCDSQGNKVCKEGYHDPTTNCSESVACNDTKIPPSSSAAGCTPIAVFAPVIGGLGVVNAVLVFAVIALAIALRRNYAKGAGLQQAADAPLSEISEEDDRYAIAN